MRQRVVLRKGQCAGRDRLPAAFLGRQQPFPAKRWSHAALASGMGQLNADARPLRVNKARNLFQPCKVVVLPDAQIGGRDAALRQPRQWPPPSPCLHRPGRGCPGGRDASRWQNRPLRSTGTWATRQCGWQNPLNEAEKTKEEDGSCRVCPLLRKLRMAYPNG